MRWATMAQSHLTDFCMLSSSARPLRPIATVLLRKLRCGLAGRGQQGSMSKLLPKTTEGLHEKLLPMRMLVPIEGCKALI